MSKKQYRGVLPPKDMPNILGPIGESLIDRPFPWTLEPAEREKIMAVIESNLTEMALVRDDRLLVLVAAMLLENCLDMALNAFSKDLDGYIQNGNIGAKIKLLRALNLVPSKILDGADFIRKTRNKFAHELEYRTFAAVPDFSNNCEKIRSVFYEELPAKDSSRDKFTSLVSIVIQGLLIYSRSIKHLVEHIRNPSFADVLYHQSKKSK